MIQTSSLPSWAPSPHRMAARFAALLLHCVLVAPCLLGAQQRKTAAAFRISGTVVNARDTSPIPHCRVAATLASTTRGGARDTIQAETDERGRFALDLPSPGKWRLVASARNFHTQALDEHQGFFTAVVLTEQQPAYDVVFRAVPDAVVSGLVTDEAGEAVRNADVSLFSIDSAQTGATPRIQQREGAQTDDRGYYEFAGLGPGKYMLNVRARPWYSLQGGFGMRPAGAATSSTSSLDPSLDLVYPITWYPGVTEDSSAGTIALLSGDRIHADFQLLPVASAHLILSSLGPRPGTTAGQNGPGEGPPGRFGRAAPNVSMLLPNGVTQQVPGNYSFSPSGEIDVGGLAPGTYEFTYPGNPGEPGRTSVVRVTSGGSFTEAGSTPSGSAVTVVVDGGTPVQASQISLVDVATGRSISASNRGRRGNFGVGTPMQRGSGQPGMRTGEPAGLQQDQPLRTLGDTAAGSQDSTSGAEVTMQVPPGRYEVMIPNNAGAFLTGISATGAQASGRFVTVPEGAARLVLHLASGLAKVEGVSAFHGKPSVGAMVLLIPATFGDPSSLTIVRRDQSDTDGSFHLSDVIPGQYILLAIDRGWAVNWNDPATLRPYLMQGTPLDLAASATVRPNIQSAAP